MQSSASEETIVHTRMTLGLQKYKKRSSKPMPKRNVKKFVSRPISGSTERANVWMSVDMYK